MAIKSILGGKSKNLCDVAYLLTLPIDTQFSNYGFWEVEVDVEPNTTYTLSRENSDLINLGATTYLGLSNEYTNPSPDDAHHRWLNHQVVPDLCRKSVTLTSNADGKLWIFFSSPVYTKWQKNLNPFGYIQIEKGSTATEYVPYELTSYKSIMKVSDVCQLVPISDKADEVVNEVTFTNNHDGGWTISGTPSTYTWYGLFSNMPLKNGHKYLNAGAGGNTYVEIKWHDKDGVIHWEANPYTADENSRCDVTLIRVTNATGVKIVFPQLFDLTEMYGAGNEPKTVAEFKAKFPNDYYPYSPSRFVTSFDERMPCKTKNLFDIGNAKIALRNDGSFYSTKDYDSNFYALLVEAGQTYTVSCDCFAMHAPGTQLQLSCQTGTSYITGTRLFVQLTTEEMINAWQHIVRTFTVPSDVTQIYFSTLKDVKYFRNFQIEKGSTATDYVPYDYV